MVASEKAAHIARVCRSESALFELLVQEKTGEDKNEKFVQDFKTLADVLIQETVRHDLSEMFPFLENRIFGEESNKFTNTLGETIEVKVQENHQKTMNMLAKILDNNTRAARVLADKVHFNNGLICMSKEVNFEELDNRKDIKLEDVGIWIDPIDATSQYIKGGLEEVEEGYPPTQGLKVVTVLIGAFSMKTGKPLCGVVNQPFVKPDNVNALRELIINDSDEGTLHWSSKLSTNLERKPRLLIGSSEDPELVSMFSEQFDVIKAGGAGHKMLMVARGLAEVYINTGASTYKWDTCAPHALLGAYNVKDCNGEKIYYNVAKEDAANKDGIIAFSDEKYYETVKNILDNFKMKK